MKKTFTYSAFLFAVLFISAVAVNAQSTSASAKQETIQQVSQPEAFFGIQSLDIARSQMEQAYVIYQNATPEQAEALGAEFRQLRRMYMVALDKESPNYPTTTETGAKIHSELLKTYKDMR